MREELTQTKIDCRPYCIQLYPFFRSLRTQIMQNRWVKSSSCTLFRVFISLCQEKIGKLVAICYVASRMVWKWIMIWRYEHINLMIYGNGLSQRSRDRKGNYIERALKLMGSSAFCISIFFLFRILSIGSTFKWFSTEWVEDFLTTLQLECSVVPVWKDEKNRSTLLLHDELWSYVIYGYFACFETNSSCFCWFLP